jgi:methionine aminopeptidase
VRNGTARPLSARHSPCVSFSDVCTKYQEAAKIVNVTLSGIVSQCVVGATVVNLCEFGHTVIQAQCAKIYTKKKTDADKKEVDRGVAFPVCISVNSVVCNHSPLLTDESVVRTLRVSATRV